MRSRSASALAAVALLAACGGEGHAGLTRERAEVRAAARAAEAERRGEVEAEVRDALAATAGESMGRAGSNMQNEPGARLLVLQGPLAKGKTASGEDAWVAAYALEGIGGALSFCVYVWRDGSAVDARAVC